MVDKLNFLILIKLKEIFFCQLLNVESIETKKELFNKKSAYKT